MDPAAEMFQEILDALVVELSKSKETRDIAGISSFLESVPVNAEGDTLLDRFAPLARTPEALAKLSIKLIDPRLTTAPAWAGVMDLLAHVRDTETTTGGR